MRRNAIFKARIEIDEKDYEVKISSYTNKNIPYGLMLELNKAVQEVARTINGTNAWKRVFIHFTHYGVKYRQIEADPNQLCKGCVFHYNKDGYSCQHPHYLDGTKGDCTGRIYIKENQ